MKKKTGAAASGTAKRRKTAVVGRKAAPRGIRKSESPSPAASIAFSGEVDTVRVQKTRQNKESSAPLRSNRNGKSSSDPKSTIRRLTTQLARALARIEELQASANTDFLLDIP